MQHRWTLEIIKFLICERTLKVAGLSCSRGKCCSAWKTLTRNYWPNSGRIRCVQQIQRSLIYLFDNSPHLHSGKKFKLSMQNRDRKGEREKREKESLSAADVISRPQKLIRSRSAAGTNYRLAESVSFDRVIAWRLYCNLRRQDGSPPTCPTGPTIRANICMRGRTA